ncbi:DNA polymerase iota [Zalerion maritima]|uniref:DNA polymerase iota n=1 Tax=Zalerion maritima TaxID=339359 RepID=A0AAD5S0D4_9PEZI|nr:DNA polymerase iota [Zalerion maritima]
MPLGVKQKSILATCNYAARNRGVKKLMLIVEAKKVCPDLVIVNGEDLSPFRDMSKRLYHFFRSYSWNERVERLGLDEVFLDVTDIVDYNLQLLNPAHLTRSFFHLSSQDPERGFPYDASVVSGCVCPSAPPDSNVDEAGGAGLSPLLTRLTMASHLASYLRAKIDQDYHLTASCGISVNKLLSKLVGSKNKPSQQTTLLAFNQESILDFMDIHNLRKVPGIGYKITSQLASHVTSHPQEAGHVDEESSVSVRDVRSHSGMSSAALSRILGGPGCEKGLGEKVWGLLHGEDPTEVKEAADIPAQISIEDTYKGINRMSDALGQLHTLSHSVIKRMHIDLMEEDLDSDTPGARRWVAHPKTVRLTTNCHKSLSPSSTGGWSTAGTENGGGAQTPQHYWAGRTSRSQPLPNFVFGLKETPEHIVERLVSEALLPMFRHLHPAKQGWNLSLINICVANMVLSGNSAGRGCGRDISVMFKRQDEVLREFTVYDDSPPPPMPPRRSGTDNNRYAVDIEWEEQEDDDGRGTAECPQCGHCIPFFAIDAHQRYHQLGN